MLWDGLVFILFVALAVAGWNIGIINSWRGPIALVVATIATQQFYVDFATWIVQQLRIDPQHAVVIGYLLLWLAIEIVVELLMSLFLPWGSKNTPTFFNRAAGAIFGIIRAAVILILPLMALNGPINVPKPPADKTPLINPMSSGIDKAGSLQALNHVALNLTPTLGKLILSDKQPSFKPNFSGNTALDEMNNGGGSTEPSKSK